MMYGYGMGGWGFLAAVISTLLFWGLVIAVIVVLVRHFGAGGRSAGATHPAPNAEQILAERYARGEIDEEEYRRRLETLRHGGPTMARS